VIRERSDRITGERSSPLAFLGLTFFFLLSSFFLLLSSYLEMSTRLIAKIVLKPS
jgi:hypothetical protein